MAVTPNKLAGIIDDVSGPQTELVEAETALTFAAESENRQDLDHHLDDAENAARNTLVLIKKLRMRIRYLDRKNDEFNDEVVRYRDAEADND